MRYPFFSAILTLCALCAAQAGAAERTFDFSGLSEGQTPPGFRSMLSGEGKPGDWRVVLDAVPSLMQPLSPQATPVTRTPVLAQVSQDPTDERFPMLVWEEQTVDDFTLTTRFKTVRGDKEQMAGLVFRLQNETNYYVVRASSLGNTFRFYKVVNGVRGNIIGPSVAIQSNVWHELTVKCKGSEIECSLDGQQLIPTLTDTSFSSGKIGFWTKSDSVSYFAETRLTYKPREANAQKVVRDVLKQNPRLLGLKVFIRGPETNATRMLASDIPSEVGQPGAAAEDDVLRRGTSYYAKDKERTAVTLPLRDRNGDPIAAVRVVMKTQPGQLEQTAVMRAMPVVKELGARAQTLQDLTD